MGVPAISIIELEGTLIDNGASSIDTVLLRQYFKANILLTIIIMNFSGINGGVV